MASKAELIRLLQRRQIVEACFEKQREPIIGAVERGERQVAILTSRRAGKTNTVLRAICRDALDHPKRRYSYIGLSRRTAEQIVWRELEAINDAHNLKLELQGYRLRAIFPNGADLTLDGADQPGWTKKFKGAKYRGVVIDEAGEFDIDLQDFIFRVIRPTLTDLQGTLWLIGTPGIVPHGYWWDVTRPDISERVKGWNVYQWHSFDNPFIEKQFRNDLEELQSIYGDALHSLPWFRREWLGEWCTDTSNNVYQYSPDVNDTFSWEPAAGDRYMLGLDPGFSDAAAFVVASYNRQKDDKLVFIESYSKPGMQFDEIADKVEMYMQKYPGIEIIGDYDAAQLLSYMRERRGIPVVDAEKQRKQHAIRLANNGFVSNRIQLLQPGCLSLGRELLNLQRSYAKNKDFEQDGVQMGEWKENPKQPNDQCDAALYVIRYALNFMYRPPEVRAEYGSEEYFKEQAAKLKRQAITKANPLKPYWKK